MLNFILSDLQYMNECLLHARVDGVLPKLRVTASTVRKKKYIKTMKHLSRELPGKGTCKV